MKTWLLDTGPLVAYLDPRDDAHEVAGAALDEFRGELFTTSAVLTEAMYFASDRTDGPELLAEFVEASSMKVVDCCQPFEMKQAALLMRKYADIPMDFADATLVHLADVLRQYSVCTLDRRGFTVFRAVTGKRFDLVLG